MSYSQGIQIESNHKWYIEPFPFGKWNEHFLYNEDRQKYLYLIEK